jgi:predicted ATPase
MPRHLFSLSVANFRNLEFIDVPLQALSVLVGPNGAGKSNFLAAVRFLGDVARLDLKAAIETNGGYDRLAFRGGSARPHIAFVVQAQITDHSSLKAPDVYGLSFGQTEGGHRWLVRSESFTFKRKGGPGRRITVGGERLESLDLSAGDADAEVTRLDLQDTSALLSTLPRMGHADGGEQVRAFAELLTTFRVFEVDVAAARRPSSLVERPVLAADASNLAAFLVHLKARHPAVFARLVDDLKAILPGLEGLELTPVGGAAAGAVVQLKEHGLRGLTPLAEASFGTVRALALLALLHDPKPPKLTCIEEIDHGLHPHALDRIVDRLRDASRRTQLLVATHSPSLVNRLRPEEIIVCERDPLTGAARIPAVSTEEVAAMVKASALSLGELWFSGALGGGLP